MLTERILKKYPYPGLGAVSVVMRFSTNMVNSRFSAELSGVAIANNTISWIIYIILEKEQINTNMHFNNLKRQLVT